MSKHTFWKHALLILIMTSYILLPSTSQAQSARADFTVDGGTGSFFIVNDGFVRFDASISNLDNGIYQWVFDDMAINTTNPRTPYEFEQAENETRVYRVMLTIEIEENGSISSKSVRIQVPCLAERQTGNIQCGIRLM